MAAILAYILLCLIWGSTWLFIRIGLQDMPPFTSLAIRLIPALLFLLVLAWRRRTALRPLLSHPWRVLQVGLLLYPGSYGLVYWSEQHVSSGLSAVVFSAMPFFVALFSWWLLPGERVARRATLGLLLGFGGLLVIYWDRLGLGSTEKFLGLLAITAAALIAAFNTVTIRRWLGEIPAVALATWTVAAGTVIIPFYALGTESASPVNWTTASVGAALYLGIFGSGISFVLYFHLLARTSALTMSLITFITPIIALTLGALFDYEEFGPKTWLGTVMVLGGVLLAALRPTTSGPD